MIRVWKSDPESIRERLRRWREPGPGDSPDGTPRLVYDRQNRCLEEAPADVEWLLRELAEEKARSRQLKHHIVGLYVSSFVVWAWVAIRLLAGKGGS